MTYDYHVVLGSAAIVIGFAAYVPYVVDIFRGKTKPHPFTWVAYAIISAIIFVAQIVKGGGAGAWATGLSVVVCSGIAGLAFVYGEKNITKLDWLCFTGALLGLVLWQVTGEPLAGVVVVTVADVLAFVPTYRKSYWKPNEESLSLYILGTLRFILQLAALESFNLTTALFPASIAIQNLIFIPILLLRRRQLARIP